MLYYLLQRFSQIIVLMCICARKSLCLFKNILDVQPKTAKRRFVAAKSGRKAMKVCNSLWKKKTKKEFKNQ